MDIVKDSKLLCEEDQTEYVVASIAERINGQSRLQVDHCLSLSTKNMVQFIIEFLFFGGSRSKDSCLLGSEARSTFSSVVIASVFSSRFDLLSEIGCT